MLIILVNKKNIFNENMLKNLEIVEYENEKEEVKYLEKETCKHFEMLKAHLKVDGIVIDINDAYRSLESQENRFLKYMKKYGLDYTERIIAMPGTTDHHTGQAIDIMIKKDNEWINDEKNLEKEIEIFNRIHTSLKYFGFVLRYPKNKENITGYSYEPWHIRYIGEEDALKIGELTLEEYLKEK